MARKLYGSLNARVDHTDGVSVVLSALKTAPYFRKNAVADLFRTIRIHRSVEAQFEFGLDYAEYFHGLDSTDGELIFEGPLAEDNERRYTFTDRDVEIGSTYAYWISGAKGEFTGPVGVRVRDPEVWWPYARMRDRAEVLRRRFDSFIEIAEIGRTVGGRELIAVRAGNMERCIALVGLVHAGEAGPELALGALELLCEECPELLERAGISIIPTLNADEREREVEGAPWYLRTNSAGVDLNRNFPAAWDTVELGYGLDSSDPTSVTYRGPFPGSEPETQAVMSFLEMLRPKAVYAFHCLASICGMGFITAREADDDYAKRCLALASPYIEGSGIDVPTDKRLGLVCSAGSLPAWCWRELDIPAFDLEISADSEPEAYRACRADRTDAAMVSQYQRIHADGIRRVLEALD